MSSASVKRVPRVAARWLVTCLAGVSLLAASPREARATTFTVNTTADDVVGACDAAHCSLREAMTAAASGGPHTIEFDIPGSGVRTITVAACLAVLNTTVTIDGYSQPGSSPNTNATGAINAVPLVEIRGQGSCSRGIAAVAGLATLTVRGVILGGFTQDQIQAQVAAVIVEGSFIGTTADGLSAPVVSAFGAGAGIVATGGTLVVGGTTPASRNVIAGNQRGISHLASGNSLVQGNLIGTNKLGTAALPNGLGFISAGTCSGGSITSQIGGSTPGARNIISGNLREGVLLGAGGGVGCSPFFAPNSLVQGNYIGTDVTGTLPLPNGTLGHGAIQVANGTNIRIGGVAAGEGNVIAFNAFAGVIVQQSSLVTTDGTRILGNRIHSNGGIGIDLQSGTTGPTANDAADADLRLQNFPVISSVSAGAGTTTIGGTLNSQANRTYRIELFVNDAVDGTGHGEGQTPIGTTDVTTDGSGSASFSVVVPASVTSLQYVTSTATDPDGNTSEFSRIDADVSLTHTDAPDPAVTGQDVTYTFTVSNAGPLFASGSLSLAYTRDPAATVIDAGGGTTSGFVTTIAIAPLAPGTSAQRSIVVRYGSPGSRTSSATITPSAVDPVPSNNTVTATTSVSPAPSTVSISGIVRTETASALPGVSLTLGGSASATTTSGANGTYSFVNLPPGGTFTVTPSIAGRTFDPISRTLTTITTNQSNVDFVGRLVYTISGQVRDLNDTGVPGVTMTLSGSQSATLSTDLDGRYVFTGLVTGGTYTVAPSKSTFVFSPPSETFASLAKDEVASFFIAEVGTFTRYFAEGATSDFFDAHFALLNATGRQATALVRFQKTDGTEVVEQVTLDGLDRKTVDPKALGLANAEFSTVIESDQPLIADRTMAWNSSHYGPHAETSIGRPLTQWFLAEGATINGFDLFYLVQNPNAQAAQVEVRYLLPSGAPLVKQYAVPASSRFNIWVNQEDARLDEAEVSAAITSNIPVIVERAMYRPVGAQVFGAGHESAGVEAPALSWYFAEGATGGFLDLFFLIANPHAQASSVKASYLKPDGSVVTRTYSVPPNSRFNVWVDYEGADLADTAVATTFSVENGVAVVIERAMWWAGDVAAWYEGHNTAGAIATGEKFGLAEGEVGGTFNLETYILIANTSSQPGTVRVTLTFEDGTPQSTRDFAIAARSRLDVAVGAEFPEAVGKRFGSIVEAVGASPVQIVVERAMYNDAGGVTWAAGTSALATKLR